MSGAAPEPQGVLSRRSAAGQWRLRPAESGASVTRGWLTSAPPPPSPCARSADTNNFCSVCYKAQQSAALAATTSPVPVKRAPSPQPAATAAAAPPEAQAAEAASPVQAAAAADEPAEAPAAAAEAAQPSQPADDKPVQVSGCGLGLVPAEPLPQPV